MKSKLIFTFLIASLISFSIFAQNKKIRFHSVNQFGMIGGESGISSAFQTINGIAFSNWFSGIGVGVDNYRYKTLPLFIDGRRYFDDENKAFVYADFGYNFPLKNTPGKEVSYYNSYDFTGGIYTDIGLGLQFSLNKKSSFLFSLGYSYKKMQNKIGVDVCGITGPCWVDYSKYDLEYGRMVLKAGFEF
jgi:hypothetical protein